MARVLGRVRLSHLTDESTSEQRQRDEIEGWARRKGHEVVAWAVDLDVSRSVDPFKAPVFSSWLTERLGEWDIVCGWRLDRLACGSIQLNRLFELCDEQSKLLASATEDFDTSTWIGRLIANVIAGVAEGELEAIRDRTQGSRKKLRELARWGGEAVHYGLQAVALADGGYRLVLDDVGVKWINQAADWVIEGESVAGATRRLKSRGVLAPRDRQREIRNQPLKGDEWSDSTLMQILRSKTLLGWTVSGGVADSTLEKSPPIMSALKFQRLQMALDRNAKPQTRPAKAGSAPLSGVVACQVCKEPLWHRAQHMPAGRGRMKTPTTYRYYYCKGKGHTKSIRADELERLSETSFLATYADVEVTEPVFIPATDYEEQIVAAELAVENLGEQLAKAEEPTVKRILGKQLDEWASRLAHYQSLPTTRGGIEYVPTGRTWKQELNSLDDEGKRALWKRVGFRFMVKQDAGGFTFSMEPPEGTALKSAVNDLMQGYPEGTTLRIYDDGSRVWYFPDDSEGPF